MPNEAADFASELRLKIDGLLTGTEIAARMARKVLEDLDRFEKTLSRRRLDLSFPQPEPEPLSVSRAETCRLLSRNRQTVWRLIRDGSLELDQTGNVTMASVKRVAATPGNPRRRRATAAK